MSKRSKEKALNIIKQFLVDLLKVILALAILGIFILVIWMVFNANENTRLASAVPQNSDNSINATIDALISQQSVTLTVTGVSVALFAIFTTLFVGVREYTIKKQKDQIEKLICELNGIHDTLIVINSFQGLKDHNLKKTKCTLMQRARKSESILALHYQLDDLYTYTSFDGRSPSTRKAYEAYKEAQEIYPNIKEKIAINEDIGDYTSIEYLSLLKFAEAGYNLLANSLDDLADTDVLSSDDKKSIYAKVTECLLKANRIFGDPDGFISCREGLLLSLRVRHNWENLDLAKQIKILYKAKELLERAFHVSDSNAVWSCSLGAICIQLAKRNIDKTKMDESSSLLDESERFCNRALSNDSNSYNAHINLASVSLYRIAIHLGVSPCSKVAGAKYNIAVDKEKMSSFFIENGIAECDQAIRINTNNIGAYRKKIAFLCVQTMLHSKQEPEICKIFKFAIKLTKKAKDIEHEMEQKSRALKRDLEMLKAHISNNKKLSQEKRTELLASLNSI